MANPLLPQGLNKGVTNLASLVLGEIQSKREQEMKLMEIALERRSKAAEIGLPEDASWSEISQRQAELANERRAYYQQQFAEQERQIGIRKQYEATQNAIIEMVTKHRESGEQFSDVTYWEELGKLTTEFDKQAGTNLTQNLGKFSAELQKDLSGYIPQYDYPNEQNFTTESWKAFRAEIAKGVDPRHAERLLKEKASFDRYTMKKHQIEEQKLQYGQAIVGLIYGKLGKKGEEITVPEVIKGIKDYNDEVMQMAEGFGLNPIEVQDVVMRAVGHGVAPVTESGLTPSQRQHLYTIGVQVNNDLAAMFRDRDKVFQSTYTKAISQLSDKYLADQNITPETNPALYGQLKVGIQAYIADQGVIEVLTPAMAARHQATELETGINGIASSFELLSDYGFGDAEDFMDMMGPEVEAGWFTANKTSPIVQMDFSEVKLTPEERSIQVRLERFIPEAERALRGVMRDFNFSGDVEATIKNKGASFLDLSAVAFNTDMGGILDMQEGSKEQREDNLKTYQTFVSMMDQLEKMAATKEEAAALRDAIIAYGKMKYGYGYRLIRNKMVRDIINNKNDQKYEIGDMQ